FMVSRTKTIVTTKTRSHEEVFGFQESLRVFVASWFILFSSLPFHGPSGDSLGQLLLEENVTDQRRQHHQDQSRECDAPVAAIVARDGDVGQPKRQGAKPLGALTIEADERDEELVPVAQEKENADGDESRTRQREHHVPEGAEF